MNKLVRAAVVLIALSVMSISGYKLLEIFSEYAQGTPAVEAGAHIAELLETILKKQVSGVGLHLEAAQ